MKKKTTKMELHYSLMVILIANNKRGKPENASIVESLATSNQMARKRKVTTERNKVRSKMQAQKQRVSHELRLIVSKSAPMTGVLTQEPRVT